MLNASQERIQSLNQKSSYIGGGDKAIDQIIRVKIALNVSLIPRQNSVKKITIKNYTGVIPAPSYFTPV